MLASFISSDTIIFLSHADHEQPNIDFCPTNITQETGHGKPTAMVTWEPPVASDNSGEHPNVICDPASGSEFTIGHGVVTCEAVDSSGNKATCSFQIGVIGMQLFIWFHTLCVHENTRS